MLRTLRSRIEMCQRPCLGTLSLVLTKTALWLYLLVTCFLLIREGPASLARKLVN